MKMLRWGYPSLVGSLLGLLQTGLFFQLSFTLSSSFHTFLMITVSWLIGGVIGLQLSKRVTWPLNPVLVMALLAYFDCVLMLALAPFQTQIWPLYAGLIVLMGLYPGLFFARLSPYYTARTLFFRENNGFILGLVGGTLLFLVMGRSALWTMPILMGGIVIFCTVAFFQDPSASRKTDHFLVYPLETPQ